MMMTRWSWTALVIAGVLGACGGGGGGAAEPDGGPAADSADAGPTPTVDAGAGTEELERLITEKMAEAHVPGLSACIVKDGAVAWCDGFGAANLELDTAVTPDTAFLIASVSKTVTGAALMQLWERDAFELDDDVNAMTPFTVASPGHPGVAVTYRQLLTHTSGVRDNWAVMAELYTDDRDPTISLADAMESYVSPDGSRYDADDNFYTYAPGSMWNYSNIGVALAAYLLELHTGEDFSDYCADNLFEPLGLVNTSWRLADFADRSRLAMPYVWTGTAYEAAGHYTFADYPSGALRTSARDLARFLLALAAGGELDGARILAASTIDDMFGAQVPAVQSDQALIWFRTQIDGEDWVAHSGGELGVSTLALLRPGDGLAIVLLMNGEGDPRAPVDDIIDLLHAHAAAL